MDEYKKVERSYRYKVHQTTYAYENINRDIENMSSVILPGKLVHRTDPEISAARCRSHR